MLLNMTHGRVKVDCRAHHLSCLLPLTVLNKKKSKFHVAACTEHDNTCYNMMPQVLRDLLLLLSCHAHYIIHIVHIQQMVLFHALLFVPHKISDTEHKCTEIYTKQTTTCFLLYSA